MLDFYFLSHIIHYAAMESSPASIAPLLLRNLITSLFVLADKSLSAVAQSSHLIDAVRYVAASSFLFFLRVLPSFIPSDLGPLFSDHLLHGKLRHRVPSAAHGGEAAEGTGIARALSQLLAIVNDIPVSSRKYDVVRSLAEKIIEENLSEGNEALREVNCSVLSAAFGRTLSQIESAMKELGRSRAADKFLVKVDGDGDGEGKVGKYYRYYSKFNRFVAAVRYCRKALMNRGKWEELIQQPGGNSAEKLAAELLWLGQKMAACGDAEEAVSKWASATNMAWLSLTTEPRLQGSIVKISAFLLKQAREMGSETDEESKKEEQRATKLEMLLLWIPLLCRASMGTDSPVLSVSERAELEKVLEDIIEALKHQEDQEKVLSLWLHHFTYCPSSDWPNLNGCFTRWCNASRRDLMLSQ